LADAPDGVALEAPGTVTMVGGEDVVDPVDYTCGACGAIVAQGVERGEAGDGTIRCNGCGATNLSPV
jgi:DNA-directed RNA polymerase subunit RPC12/RpoP